MPACTLPTKNESIIVECCIVNETRRWWVDVNTLKPLIYLFCLFSHLWVQIRSKRKIKKCFAHFFSLCVNLEKRLTMMSLSLLAKCGKRLPCAGLEPATFGLEVQRAIHCASKATVVATKRGEYKDIFSLELFSLSVKLDRTKCSFLIGWLILFHLEHHPRYIPPLPLALSKKSRKKEKNEKAQATQERNGSIRPAEHWITGVIW